MKFSVKDFSSKCGQIRRKLRIWSHLLKKSLMETFTFSIFNDYVYIILPNIFQACITPQNVVEVSGNLKRIVNNNTLNDINDIDLVTIVMEKIIGSLRQVRKNESEVCFYQDPLSDIQYHSSFIFFTLKIDGDSIQ